MVGLIKAGTPRSGYLGFDEGAYAFQHAEIGIVMQLVGIAACLAAGIVTAAILAFILERTTGLRVPEEEQAEGLDKVRWGLTSNQNPI